jgi:hypothetical protein
MIFLPPQRLLTLARLLWHLKNNAPSIVGAPFSPPVTWTIDLGEEKGAPTPNCVGAIN